MIMPEKKEKQVKKLDATKTGFSTQMGKMPLEKFEKWFNSRYEGGDPKKIHAELKKQAE